MGKDCWSPKEVLLTNCCHETIHHIYVSAMSHTHWSQYYQILPTRKWWQLTCASLSCLLSIWSMTDLVFMWRHLSITYLLIDFVSLYHSIWWPPTSLSNCCHLNFPMPMCNLKMHTQNCGNFVNTMRMTSFHVQFLCFRTCLNHVNVVRFWMWPLLKCRFNT